MLYTKDKSGKIRYWSVTVDEEEERVFVTKRFGQEGGKETMTRTEIKSGKNLGKKNETTRVQQAQMEAQSLRKKQMDSGYVEDRDSLETRVLILPMLANKWEDKAHYISEPFYVQPKLDGVRMLVGKHEGKILMLSRTGKPIKHMEHISNEIGSLLNEGDFLDGESYNHDITFEEITGMCRTALDSSAASKDLTKIQFHVFDFFNLKKLDETFEERFKRFQKFFQKVFQNVEMVPTNLVKDRSSIPLVHEEYIKSGYEGVMMRDPKGKYTLAERSNHLLKFKSFQTDEYKVIDAEEAKGRDIGTVVWVCETPEGHKFSVRPRGMVDQRRNWLANKDTFLGKMLTVQYQNLTPDGIPRFPVGLSFRDYE